MSVPGWKGVEKLTCNRSFHFIGDNSKVNTWVMYYTMCENLIFCWNPLTSEGHHFVP